MSPSAPTRADRFFSKVDKNGPLCTHLGTQCWLWTGARGGGKYGNFFDGTRTVGAHRWSYTHAYGEPPDKHDVDHKCHVPHCVNPEHLRAVTHAENMQHGIDRPTGKSGVRGVRWTKGAWEANVKHNGIVHYVGRFNSIEAASAAAQTKRLELYTHNDRDKIS